jgi:dihydroorotase-like cyclic amidohydrolase
VVDLDLEQVVTTESCHSAQDHTPSEGIAVKGWPTDTILRGEAVG